MNSQNKATTKVIEGKIAYFCKCELRLTVKTSTTRTNPGKRFVKCSVCRVYEFLDADLPSDYYKELVHGFFEKEKRANKTVEYQHVIETLALDKSMMEHELADTKAKLKLYERLFFILLASFGVVCVGFGVFLGK